MMFVIFNLMSSEFNIV